jgi:pSer/pThr/pTyr-binding forkhead associated (FHA) protein/outer membrane biosynthesis protein TonB
VPRAKPYPDAVGEVGEGDEEEKTTIESGWEDEASTTVEQGQLDNKIRNELGLELPTPPRSQQQQLSTGITQTGAVDEPTVDDQHVPQLSTITPLRQDQNARLSITQGNDTGQAFEILPGKTYTIGRAIDNDVVLTDIAVSRKHFDLRFEDGSWVIVDRGSGNGTVVNGNVEDNPFMLASGDVIEIGNTVFRFEQDKGATGVGHSRQHIEPLEDEEELSTVAGKPMRAEVIEVVEQAPPLRARSDRPLYDRPKTLPPPLPLRGNPATQPPPLSLPPQASSTLPLPQMANRPPPAMLGEPIAPMNPMVTMPQGTQPRPIAYPTYPQGPDIPPHSVHAQMLLIQTQNRRGDGSTMHVPPTPYDGMVAAPNLSRWSPPQLTKRAKLIFAGAGIAALAAIATIAIVSSDDKPKASAKKAATVEPIKQPEPVAKIETLTPPTPVVETPKPEVKIETPVIKVEPKKPEAQKIETPPKKTEQRVEKRVEPKRVEPKRVESPPREKEPKREPKRVATADSSSAKSKAESLYRAKKFSDASSTLMSAAKSASDDEARELKKLAEYYSGLGKAMNAGMAPGTDATVAFENLRRASNYDKNVGGFYDSDIQSKLALVAPKAAFSYYAKKNYQAARVAVISAEQYGNAEGVSIVRQKLESVARDLYNDAQSDKFQSSSSKDKLKQIKLIVDSKSPWYQKASKALGT